MTIGFIGLGKMGSRMAEKLLWEGHEVVAWNRSPEPADNLLLKAQSSKIKGKLTIVKTVKELIDKLSKPKIVWSMLPAGIVTHDMLKEIQRHVEKEDIVIDGSNARFTDTEKRYAEFGKKGIRFLGIGVSGGIIAAEQGYPLMVGGDKNAYEYIVPLLDSLSIPHGGNAYFGTGGAGHFIKMIHNGIEYGIMQSLAEGFAVLEKAPYTFDLPSVAKMYQKNTLVSGFMLDRLADVLQKHPGLENFAGIIEASGEADWAVQQAQKEGVVVPVIEASLDFRKQSRKNLPIQRSFTARIVNGLRHAFGGHKVVKKD